MLVPISQSMAHGVQVAYCELNNGYLRIFIEHWHGNLSIGSLGSNDNMQIQTTVNGSSSTQTINPTGTINNTTKNNISSCGSSISILSACSGSANSYNDWVYYDFAPAACGTSITFTLLQGNSVVLTEACSNLYPASVTATFYDNSPPVLTCPDVTAYTSNGSNVSFQ